MRGPLVNELKWRFNDLCSSRIKFVAILNFTPKVLDFVDSNTRYDCVALAVALSRQRARNVIVIAAQYAPWNWRRPSCRGRPFPFPSVGTNEAGSAFREALSPPYAAAAAKRVRAREKAFASPRAGLIRP